MVRLNYQCRSAGCALTLLSFKERLQQIMPKRKHRSAHRKWTHRAVCTVSSINGGWTERSLAQRYAPDRFFNLMTVGGTQQVMLECALPKCAIRGQELDRAALNSTGNACNGTEQAAGHFGSVAGNQPDRAANADPPALDNRQGSASTLALATPPCGQHPARSRLAATRCLCAIYIY